MNHPQNNSVIMLLKKNTLKWQDLHSIAEIQIENITAG